MNQINRIDPVPISSLALHLFTIVIVCFFAFFINNQVIPADLMESRNLATAQEMVKYDSYLTPTMNGDLRLEKPPLPTWIAAGMEHLMPESLPAQRCLAGLAATLMVIFLYLLTGRLTRNRTIGLIAALILASTFNVVMMGRTATWDIYSHSFMLGALYFLVIALEREGKQWGMFMLTGLFLGLSFLSKGPVSFYALFLPFVIAYLVIYRPKANGKLLPILVATALFIFVSFWWMAYIYLFHRDMALHVAGKESSSWLNHNVRPWYYYWQFPVEAGIWALFWVTSLVSFFFRKKKNDESRKTFTFSIVWLFASLFLLSVIPEKKTRYLLPILIPGAMTIAFYIYQSHKELANRRERTIFRANGLLIALVLLALPIAFYFLFYREGQLSFGLLIGILLISWLLCAWIIHSLFIRKDNPVSSVFCAIILSMMMIESLCLIPIGKMFVNPERHSIRLLREHKELDDLPFFYNKDEELRMELVYEANRVIRPIDLKDDASLQKNRPFVLLIKQPVDSLLKNKGYTIKHIDTFDNNWQKVNSKRYNNELVREVVLIQ